MPIDPLQPLQQRLSELREMISNGSADAYRNRFYSSPQEEIRSLERRIASIEKMKARGVKW